MRKVKDELLGKQLASYQLVQLLGQGAFGSVYLGKHFLLTQKPPVAIKILNTALNSQEEFDRFFQEAVLLDTLSHPHILPILDANLYEGYPYFVAEYAQGGSLQDRLEQLNGEPMPLDEALQVLKQTGDGLQHAHDLDVVHRDLKPANILFDANGEAMLADFGIALQVQRTRRVDEIGTPAYMSPEQFKGKISKKSDQYALGCIAYEIVTGQQLFIADDPYTIGYKHIYEAPIEPHTLNPGISPAIEAVILKALSKEHNDRYDSVADFVQALLDAATQDNLPGKRSSTLDTRRTGKQVVPKKAKKTPIPEPEPQYESGPTGNERKGTNNTERPGSSQPMGPKRVQPQPTRTSQQAVRNVTTQFIPTWSTTTGLDQVYYAEPVVKKGIIYAGTYSTAPWNAATHRHLRALDASTGEHLWSYKTNFGIYDAPIVATGIVYFCAGHTDNGGKIWALDADTGEAFWSLETDEPLKTSPIIINDIVYIHSQHAVYALNAATGQQYWDVTLKAELKGRPMIADNAIYIGTERGHCYSVDADHGQKIATYTDVGHLHAIFKLDDNTVCLFTQGDQFYALDMHTGETYWSIRTELNMSTEVEIVDGIAYISMLGTLENTSARTTLLAIDIVTGEQLWVTYLRNEIDATPLIIDNVIYLITRSQDLYMLDTQQGKRIHSFRIGQGKISRPCVNNGWLYISNNEINAFKLS
jgi:serine/threonine protein kinase